MVALASLILGVGVAIIVLLLKALWALELLHKELGTLKQRIQRLESLPRRDVLEGDEWKYGTMEDES